MRVLLIGQNGATPASVKAMLIKEKFVCDTADFSLDGLEIGSLDYDVAARTRVSRRRGGGGHSRQFFMLSPRIDRVVVRADQLHGTDRREHEDWQTAGRTGVAQGAVGPLPYRGHGLLAGQPARRQCQEQ